MTINKEEQIIHKLFLDRLEVINNKLNEIEQEITFLQEEKNAILDSLKRREKSNQQNQTSNITITNKNINSNGYLTGWSILKKTLFILKQARCPLTTGEVVDALIKLEPSFNTKKRALTTQVSSQLGHESKKEKGKIKREKNNLDKLVYSLY